MGRILRAHRSLALLVAVGLAAWGAVAPIRAMAPHLETERSCPSPPAMPRSALPDVQAVPLPRITCPEGYSATVYVEGLSSPDGMALDPDGVLYVAEETAGRVSRIGPGGVITPVVTGLDSPEGIDFDPRGNLYVVEDVENGRLVCVDPGGGQLVLAQDRDAPEGVVWSPDDSLYITESTVQFALDPPWDYRTGVTRVSQGGDVTTILTNTLAWSYSGITLGGNGLLYVANEASGVGTADSVFQVNPFTGMRVLLVSGLIAPEGLRFSPNGGFPLYVAEEDVGSGNGRISQVQADGTHETFCTGFYGIEDVVLDQVGNLYVSEDTSGMIVKIARMPSYRVFLPSAVKE